MGDLPDGRSDRRFAQLPRPIAAVLIRTALLLRLVALAGLLTGCQRAEVVEHYRQLKPEAVLKTYFGETAPPPVERAPPESDRMFAAIVVREKQFWFFKLVGPIEAVDRQSEAFFTLIRSVHFNAGSENGKPTWTLPQDWRELPASGTGFAARFATLQIGSGEKPLEVAVTSLPLEGIEALLMNINRWRGEMGLGPLESKEQFDETINRMKTSDGDPALLVSLAGRFQAGGMGRPPFAAVDKKDLPPGHPSIEPKDGSADAAAAPSPEALSAPLKFDTPAGWHVGEPDAMTDQFDPSAQDGILAQDECGDSSGQQECGWHHQARIWWQECYCKTCADHA